MENLHVRTRSRTRRQTFVLFLNNLVVLLGGGSTYSFTINICKPAKNISNNGSNESKWNLEEFMLGNEKNNPLGF